jgi:putative transposase
MWLPTSVIGGRRVICFDGKTLRGAKDVDPAASFPPDLVGRHFDRGRINTVWSSGITYLSCGNGDMYL